MASLRILTGSLENEEIELTPDPMTVGRSSACNIRIGDAGVSSKHAKIWCEDGNYFLMDLGSTNGTFVNDKDVDREQLNDGDVITFGMTKAQFIGDKPKARVNPARAGAAPAGRGGAAAAGQRPVSNPGMRVPGASARGGAAPAPAAEEVPAEGIVTDAPRKSANASLRAEVRTQDEVEIATLRGKVAFFEEENRKLKAQMTKVQETAAHEASAGARA